jgi:hypothetical protein
MLQPSRGAVVRGGVIPATSGSAPECRAGVNRGEFKGEAPRRDQERVRYDPSKWHLLPARGKAPSPLFSEEHVLRELTAFLRETGSPQILAWDRTLRALREQLRPSLPISPR